MKKSKFSFRGMTLTEALLFMGLAAVAIVSAFALYNNATGKSKMNEARVQLQAYVGNIQSLYATQNSYQNLNTSLVVNAGLAPKQAIDGNTLVNPWGGSTTVAPANSNRNFSITFAAVPQDACVSLLSSGLLNNGTVISMGANGNNQTTEFTPSTAISACNSNSNSVLFTSR